MGSYGLQKVTKIDWVGTFWSPGVRLTTEQLQLLLVVCKLEACGFEFFQKGLSRT